jgi:zinc protease
MSGFVKRTVALLVVGLVVSALVAPDALARQKPWEKFKYPQLGVIQMPDYERVELDNGMVVYLAEDHEFPLVELSATIRAGSIYEPTDKIGLAEITGTVLRTGGTDKMTGDEIDELVESKGMRLETWIQEASGGAYLSALQEDTPQGLSLLADILMHPRFDPDKIEIAKQEQKAGISRRNDEPMTIARREATKAIFGPDHPLARQPEYDTINAVTRDDLIAYHQRFFHPNTTYLVVIGDFERPAMLALLKQTFADWQRTSQPLPPDPEIPVLPATVNVVDKDDLTQSTMVVGHMGIRADSPYYAGIMVANRILGGGFSSRLFNEVRTKRGYAYSVGSMPGTGFRFPGVFLASCGTKSSTTQAAAEVIIDQIRKMTSEPVTDEELAVAKDGILNSEVFNFDTKREILDRLVMYEMNGYPPDFLQQYQEQVRDMTKEKVLEATQAVWHPDRLIIMALGNRADWDGDLSEFGPVNDVDITIPEPTLTLDIPLATAESLQQGQALMTQTAAAVGGKKLAQLKSWREKINLAATIQGMSLNIGIDKTVVLPDKLRLVQSLPFGEATIVVNGEGGWMKGPMGEKDLEPDQVQDQQKDLATDTLMLLAHHGDLQCQALSPAEVEGRQCDRVYVTGAGDDYVLLFLDPTTHLPYVVQSPSKSPMTQAPVTQQVIMDGYKPIGGFQTASSFTIKHDGEVFATGTLESWEANPKVDTSLFQK